MIKLKLKTYNTLIASFPFQKKISRATNPVKSSISGLQTPNKINKLRYGKARVGLGSQSVLFNILDAKTLQEPADIEFNLVQNYFIVFPHIKVTYTGPTYTVIVTMPHKAKLTQLI